jgi:hypothetical protein
MSSGNEPARSDVLLVGSLPFDTAEEALRQAGSGLAGHVGWIPDGEVGPRVNWVGMLPAVVFPGNPDLEETMAPPEHELEQPDHEGDDQPVEDLPGIWNWRIKPGHKVRFDDLAYGTYAKESYEVLKRLRGEGAVPQDVRFQLRTARSTASSTTTRSGRSSTPPTWRGSAARSRRRWRRSPPTTSSSSGTPPGSSSTWRWGSATTSPSGPS